MHNIFSYWSFDYINIAFLILLCAVYFYAINFKLKKQSIYFFAGILLLIICVASPLHFLGENYLFSIHMLTHTLILLIAAPLIVAGIPANNRFQKIFISLSEKIKKLPFACWFAGVGVMWFWHIPSIFNQLFMNDMMHSSSHIMNGLSYIHMLSLLMAGMLFSLPIINPYSQYRIAPLTAVLYLSTACVGCSLLGLLITFSPLGIYTHYLNITGNFSEVIRNDWKISAATDQQTGGLIMWVPCCFIYLSASMYLLIKWFDDKKVVTQIETNYTN